MTTVNMPLNLEGLLDGLQMPASKEDIIIKAEEENGSREAMTLLQALPADEYATIKEINKDLALTNNLPGHENQWPSEEGQELMDTAQQDLTKLAGKG